MGFLTSYDNFGGKGKRLDDVKVDVNFALSSGEPYFAVDGMNEFNFFSYGDNREFYVGNKISFTFAKKVAVDEMTFYNRSGGFLLGKFEVYGDDKLLGEVDIPYINSTKGLIMPFENREKFAKYTLLNVEEGENISSSASMYQVEFKSSTSREAMLLKSTESKEILSTKSYLWYEMVDVSFENFDNYYVHDLRGVVEGDSSYTVDEEIVQFKSKVPSGKLWVKSVEIDYKNRYVSGIVIEGRNDEESDWVEIGTIPLSSNGTSVVSQNVESQEDSYNTVRFRVNKYSGTHSLEKFQMKIDLDFDSGIVRIDDDSSEFFREYGASPSDIRKLDPTFYYDAKSYIQHKSEKLESGKLFNVKLDSRKNVNLIGVTSHKKKT